MYVTDYADEKRKDCDLPEGLPAGRRDRPSPARDTTYLILFFVISRE